MTTGGRDPDFIILGAQRAGTTSLFRYLAAHPRVAAPRRKELHFFSHFYDRGIDWYRAQFPSDRSERPVTGEATPYYLFHPHAPARIARDALRAKLIVLLRNPIDRAYSHYQHEVRRGDETLSFEEAIALEPARLRGEEDRMLADPHYRSFAHQHHSYLARGHYAVQLKRWFALTHPGPVLVLPSEHLYRNPTAAFAQVTGFLGLPPVDLIDPRAYNDDPYPPMAPETRIRLAEYFATANGELTSLLGSDFEWR